MERIGQGEFVSSFLGIERPWEPVLQKPKSAMDGFCDKMRDIQF